MIAPITPEPPFIVERPVMIHRWEALTFLHWSIEPRTVARVLPPGLEPDLFDGRAWVGLVPFLMKIRVPRGPFVPWLSIFPETNVRTYVRGPDGGRGIWFCSLDVPRAGAVAVARATYGIPYCWSRMRIARSGDRIVYRSTRRWPSPRGAGARVAVEFSDPIPDRDVSDLEHFITARWGLYSVVRRRLAYAPVSHRRWPLRRARALVEESLLAAAGVGWVTDRPLVHASDGVEVRIGRPRAVV